ncbi:hypothetical protein Tco_1286971, partial [Tanacetum coccineum]
MVLPPCEQRHRVSIFDFGGLSDLMAEGLSGRMLIEHRDEAGASVFTSKDWRRMLDIRGPLVQELILEFFTRLVKHFGLLNAEILRGLTVIALELPIINMTELLVAAAGALAVAEDALIIDKGGQADSAPKQAPKQSPPPPPAHAKTMPQRMARLEEDVHEIRQGLIEQREVIDAMAHDFYRFSTWVTTGLGWMMDMTGVAYMSYAQTYVSYQRCVRQRTGEASTSAAKQDQ